MSDNFRMEVDDHNNCLHCYNASDAFLLGVMSRATNSPQGTFVKIETYIHVNNGKNNISIWTNRPILDLMRCIYEMSGSDIVGDLGDGYIGDE